MSGNPIERVVTQRLGTGHESQPPNDTVLTLQRPVYELLTRYYFRLEVTGWERVPERTSLLVGVHSGGALTMDAWTLIYAWHKHFRGQRLLRGTAHDVLMAAPFDPIELTDDRERVDDAAYVQKIYDQVEHEIQAGMDRLAAERILPVFT